MTNTVRGTMTVEALGKTWTLKLSTNALCELEEQLGQGIESLGAMLQDPNQGRMKLFRLVVWAALTDNHPDIKLTDAGTLIDALGMEETMSVLQRLMTLTMPEQKKGVNGSPRKATPAKTGGLRS